jgi:hypothetical protein
MSIDILVHRLDRIHQQLDRDLQRGVVPVEEKVGVV